MRVGHPRDLGDEAIGTGGEPGPGAPACDERRQARAVSRVSIP